MAYMNQERKSRIVAALKNIPGLGDWTYSLKVRNNSTICMTIRTAPYDLLKPYRIAAAEQALKNGSVLFNNPSYAQLNVYWLDTSYDGEVLAVLEKIKDALNLKGSQDENFDKSDIQSDYFHVGWYVEISVGDWETPFYDTIPGTIANPPKPVKQAKEWVAKTGTSKSVKNPAGWASSNPAMLALLKPFLPEGWEAMTPGRKSAATKKAKIAAGVA